MILEVQIHSSIFDVNFRGVFFRWFINGYMIAVCNNYNSGKVHDVYMSGKIDFIKATTYDLGQR